MRMLRYLLAIGLVGALTGIAKADDFQMVVIDPVPSIYVTPILTADFSFSFSDCHSPSQVPVGSPYIGCFSGENVTGTTLTSFRMLIPIFGGQTAGCSPYGGGLDIFESITCGTTPDGLDFFLDFSDGSIPSAVGNCTGGDDLCNQPSIFTIAEAGVAPGDFPDDIPVVTETPEPNSLLLLSTGVLFTGFFFARRRQQAHCPIPSQFTQK